MAIYRRGNIYWCDIRTASGKRLKRSLGTTDRTAAQEFHDKIKHDLWRVEALGSLPNVTWDEAALRWLEEKAHKRSIKTDAAIIAAYTEHFTGRMLRTLGAEEIRRVTRRITTGKVFYNRHIACLRAILNRAERVWRWLERAPALILNPEPRRRIRWITRAEAAHLLDELPDHLCMMSGFSLQTGLRQANVTGLRWDWVDLSRRLVIVPAEHFKTGKDHSVPLTETAIGIIRSQMGKHLTHVFTYRGNPVSQVNTKAFRAALRRAGIANFKWHDFRHTWASWLVQSGVPLVAVQELGGWESFEMVRRYAHLSRDHLAGYMEVLEGTISPTVELERKTG